MAFVLHREAGLTAAKLSSEDLPDLDSWLLGVGKILLLEIFLTLFQPPGPGVSQCYLGSLESHQELRRREEHYQSMMQIPGFCAYFRIG